MIDPRGSFSIWEEADDGRLNVKLLAWNRLYQPQSLEATTPTQAFASAAPAAALRRTGDFAAVLDGEEIFHHAFETRDLKAASDYYADDATLIVPDSTPLRGHAAIARYIEAVPPERSVATIERQVAQVEGNDDYVLVVNLFRWHFVQPDSGQPVAIAGKGVHLWQKDGQGRWRILFDLCNTSQPVSG